MPMTRRLDAGEVLERREAGDHAGVGRAGHGADDDRVEVHAEGLLLLGQLEGVVGEPDTAEGVLARAGRDRVRRATALLDLAQGVLPRVTDADVEAVRVEARVGAHHPREQDVADLVVDRVVPRHPLLLHETALQAEVGGDRGDLAGVVRLVAADGDEGVGAAGEHVGDDVLELADLVAAEREATVDVLTLGPHLGTAEVVAQPAQVLQRAGAEGELVPGDVVQAHGAGSTTDNPDAVRGVRGPVLCPVTTELPPGLTARPFTLDDLDAAFAVYSAAELEDSGRLALEPEDIAGDWARPSFDLAADSIGVFDGDRLVGAAEVTRGGARAEGAVLPGERGRGIGSWLAAWTEQRATSLRVVAGRPGDPGRVAPPAPPDSVVATPWATRRGCSSCPRVATVPQRPLPAGYTLATADTDRRVSRRPTSVIQDAFDEWEGRVRESFEDWARDDGASARRPAVAAARRRARRGRRGCVVHDPGQPGLRGTCTSWPSSAPHRGQGLAQALLADAFGRARERGATRSELSTDSRTGALDLYLKVGMEVTQVWTHLVTDAAPLTDRPVRRRGCARARRTGRGRRRSRCPARRPRRRTWRGPPGW